MTTNLTGCFLGYDPGGTKSATRGTGHGVAAIEVVAGEVRDCRRCTKTSTTEALDWFDHEIGGSFGEVLGIGVDTLTYWSGGHAGWRGADLWLRKQVSETEHGTEKAKKRATNAVTSPNSLRGSMCLNGVFALRRLRGINDAGVDMPREASDPQDPGAGQCGLYATETHPKVLFYCMSNEPYDYPSTVESKHPGYEGRRKAMNDWLARAMGLPPLSRGEKLTEDSHQWDALISAWAAFLGRSGAWETDLVDKETNADELDFPAGGVEYRWPDEEWLAEFLRAPRIS